MLFKIKARIVYWYLTSRDVYLELFIYSTGVLYPEFRNRCPPPTYNASAQDYQHHLLMAQIQLAAAATLHNTEYVGLPTSPPPTYRSRAATLQRPTGAAPLHLQQQRPPIDPLPTMMMVAAPSSSSSNSSVRPPPTAAVQPPPGYNNSTLPFTIRRVGSETNNGAAATSETDANCGRCSGVPQQPELACQSGSSAGNAGGQQRPRVIGGGGGGVVVQTTTATRGLSLRSWTTGDGGEGNSNGCAVTTGETTPGKTNERLP